MKKNILLCVDRDGTLIYDDHYHLGIDNYWRKKIKILPGRIEGMKKFNKNFPDACRFIITNQPGVAIKEFKRLTLKRARDVCKEITLIFKRKGAYFDGCIVCPHVTPEYTKKNPQYQFDRKYIDPKCKCFKPNTGMIEEAMEKKGLNPKKTKVYVIGDRESDILTALKSKGIGILVPSKTEWKKFQK